jgi:RNA polymerase sigma factor (sigma-70 family)
VIDAPEDRDAGLHLGIIGRQEEAIAAWEERYRRVMCASAARKGLPTGDAEDAFADTLLEVVLKAPDLLPMGEGLRRFAYTVFRNKVADRLRKRPPVPLASLDDLVGTQREPSAAVLPLSALQAEQVSPNVSRCLEQLSDRDRLLIESIYFEEISPIVIAERSGVKLNSVYQAAGRALKRVRPCLEKLLLGV